MFEYLSQIDRFLHVLFGITWIGLLYYFNFVGAGYLKEATPEGKKDVLLKLQPNALWYFRWAALFTFLTGLYLLWYLDYKNSYSIGISLGSDGNNNVFKCMVNYLAESKKSYCRN